MTKGHLRGMQQALFVLEKNAQNWGSSNKSKTAIDEHREALRLLQEFSVTLRERKDLDAENLCNNLLRLLNPSKSSVLAVLNKTEQTELKMETITLMTNLISGEKWKAKIFAALLIENNIFNELTLLLNDDPVDLKLIALMKGLVLSLVNVLSFREVTQQKKLMMLLLKLVSQININVPAEKLQFYQDLMVFVFSELDNGFEISASLSKKLKLQLIDYLIKMLPMNADWACNQLLQLSQNKEGCLMIAKEDGLRVIVEACLNTPRDNQTKRLALTIIKNVLKSIDEIDSISLYEQILELGGVVSLDDFVGDSKTNKTFSERMIRQQVLMRTKSKKSVKKFKGPDKVSIDSTDI